MTLKKRLSAFVKKDNIKDLLQSDDHYLLSLNNNEESQKSQNKINNNNNLNISTNRFNPSIQRKSTHAGSSGKNQILA